MNIQNIIKVIACLVWFIEIAVAGTTVLAVWILLYN